MSDLLYVTAWHCQILFANYKCFGLYLRNENTSTSPFTIHFGPGAITFREDTFMHRLKEPLNERFSITPIERAWDDFLGHRPSKKPAFFSLRDFDYALFPSLRHYLEKKWNAVPLAQYSASPLSYTMPFSAVRFFCSVFDSEIIGALGDDSQARLNKTANYSQKDFYSRPEIYSDLNHALIAEISQGPLLSQPLFFLINHAPLLDPASLEFFSLLAQALKQGSWMIMITSFNQKSPEGFEDLPITPLSPSASLENNEVFSDFTLTEQHVLGLAALFERPFLLSEWKHLAASLNLEEKFISAALEKALAHKYLNKAHGPYYDGIPSFLLHQWSKVLSPLQKSRAYATLSKKSLKAPAELDQRLFESLYYHSKFLSERNTSAALPSPSSRTWDQNDILISLSPKLALDQKKLIQFLETTLPNLHFTVKELPLQENSVWVLPDELASLKSSFRTNEQKNPLLIFALKPLPDNGFYALDSSDMIVCLSDYRYFSSLPLENLTLYFILKNIYRLLLDINPSASHDIHCLYHPFTAKNSLDDRLKNACLCRDCQEKLYETKTSSNKLLKLLNETLALLRETSGEGWSIFEDPTEQKPSPNLFSRDKLKNFCKNYHFTDREEALLEEMIQGKASEEMEKKFYISGSTVRKHIYNIYQKTGVKNRVRLLGLYYQEKG